MDTARRNIDSGQEVERTLGFFENTVYRAALVIAAIVVIAAAAYMEPKLRELSQWLVSIAAGAASMLAGAVVGLLFAVPRRSNQSESQVSAYAGNDNLVKVSDWLTGALTGIALATGSDIAMKVWALSKSMLPGYPGFAAACISGGFSAGFLLAYLRLRAKLQFIFAIGDQRANDVARRAEEAEKINFEATLASASPMSGEQSKMRQMDATTRVRAIREMRKEAWVDDAHKGQFGGSPLNGDLEMRVERAHITGSGMLLVDVQVRTRSGAAIPDLVEFHLDESLPEPVVRKTFSAEGVASVRVPLWETFTLGAIVSPGARRLELDLSADESIPMQYREPLSA